MRKILSFLIIICLLIGIIPICTMAAAAFSDVPKGAFYEKDLIAITNDPRHILEGYKGLFHPNDPLTVAQFIKIAVAASNRLVPAQKKNEKWYSPYLTTASEMGYIKDGEFIDYEKNITRGEMARILIRAVENVTGAPTYRDPQKVKAVIKDYATLPDNLKDYIVKCYDIGLIGGYSNGTFGPNDKFTRGQAVAVTSRLLFPENRLKVDIDNVVSNATKTYDGITFNPYTDTTGQFNVMKLDKAEEFAMKTFNSLQFYVKDGKAYAKGYLPVVPEGFHLDFRIDINMNAGTGIIGISTSSKIENNKLPKQGIFEKYLNINRKEIMDMDILFVISRDSNSEYDSNNYDDGSFDLSYPQKIFTKVGDRQTTILKCPEGVFAQW